MIITLITTAVEKIELADNNGNNIDIDVHCSVVFTDVRMESSEGVRSYLRSGVGQRSKQCRLARLIFQKIK